MIAFYNEHDAYAAQWLRNLIAAGHIAPGIVSEDDIRDLDPDYLRQFVQCHFFAGVGVWSHALRSAGWSDATPVWTGSCPCQPFSAAGQRAGEDDERHLWPHFHWLIDQCRPPVVLGEQVASKDGLGWLDLVQADLEASGYAVGASDLCAAGFGGAHLRQRLYFVGMADAASEQHYRRGVAGPSGRAEYPDSRAVGGVAHHHQPRLEGRSRVSERADQRAAGQSGVAGGMADTDSGQRSGVADGEGCQPDGQTPRREQGDSSLASRGSAGRMVDANLPGQHGRTSGREQPLCDERDERDEGHAVCDPGEVDPRWAHVDWLLCRNPAGEPSWRPVEPGSFPLAHGVAARMGKLRAYGNALDAETAQGFAEAVMDVVPMIEMLS